MLHEQGSMAVIDASAAVKFEEAIRQVVFGGISATVASSFADFVTTETCTL